MRYLPESRLDGEPHIRIGAPAMGSSPGGWVFSAGPGVILPPSLRADTVTGQVLRYLRTGAPDAPPDVACAEFSGDHLLAVWALCEPEEALQRATLVEQSARASLFGLAPDETLAKIACFFIAYPDESGTTDAGALFTELLPRVVALLDNPRDFDLFWIGEYSDVTQANSMLNSGAVQIEEHPDLDLSVLHTPLRLHDLTRLTAAPFARMLQIRSENTYLLEYRRESWVRYPQGHPLPRIDLRPLAQRLSLFERAAGRWRADPVDAPVSRLLLDGGRGIASPSLIDSETMIEEVLDYLRSSAHRKERQWMPGRSRDDRR